MGFPGDWVIKNLPEMQETLETQVWSLGGEDPLEEGMATHSSILAWRMDRRAWQATVHRLANWSDLAHMHIHSFMLLCEYIQVKVKVKFAQLCPTLCDPMDYSPWNSPGQNTGVGSHSLLQGIFPTQGSNPCLPHCRQILYQLSHKGSPYIQETCRIDCFRRTGWLGDRDMKRKLVPIRIPAEVHSKGSWMKEWVTKVWTGVSTQQRMVVCPPLD